MSDDAILAVEGSVVAAEFMGMLLDATLVGHQVPRVADMWAAMSNPLPGDRIVVLDSIAGDDADRKWKGSGVLLKVESNKREGRVWHVQYGPADADVCRWSNCTVYAIPDHQKLQAWSSSDPKGGSDGAR